MKRKPRRRNNRKNRKVGDFSEAPKGMFLMMPKRKRKDWSWDPPKKS